MRQLLRVVAWLLARLLLVTALCFVVLAPITHSTRRDPTSDRIEQLQRPLFLNRAPEDIVVYARRLVSALESDERPQTRDELRRLGGAAFPILLPELAMLSEPTQTRLAWALLPVAQRMGWRGASEVASPAAATQFLLRAWMERSSDFHPGIAERWVHRLTQRESPGLYASVAEFDSYALPALMAALPVVSSQNDVEVASRITRMACHVTGFDWMVEEADPPYVARTTVNHWKRWWRLHGSEYVVLQGPSRWSAMLTETQFGAWLLMATSFRFGDTLEGTPIWDLLLPATGDTLLLLALAAFGSSACQLLLARSPLSHPRRSRLIRALPLLSSVPTIAVIATVSWLTPSSSSLGWIAAKTSLVTAFIALAAQRAPVDPSARFDQFGGLGSSAVRRGYGSVKAWLFHQWQNAGHIWPFLLLLIFVLERAFQVPGLSALLTQAFRHRDLHCLMAVTTTTALGLLLVVGFRRSEQRPTPPPLPNSTLPPRTPSADSRLERLVGAIALSLGVGLALLYMKPLALITMLGWTAFEIALTVLLALLMTALSLLVIGRRTRDIFDLGVSRCLEVIAALPIVLSCCVAVVATGWWTPLAIAWVLGLLNGLSCLRYAIQLPQRLAPYEAQISIMATLGLRLRQASRSLFAVVVTQVVEVDAAIVFLGLAASAEQGGLGQSLGLAITSSNPTAFVACLLLATGGVLLLRLPGRPPDRRAPA